VLRVGDDFFVARPSAVSAGDPLWSEGGTTMLRWAIIFFIVAIIAALFGFTGIAGAAAWIAQVLFFLFLVFFVIALVMGLLGGRSKTPPA
jgi:uncharacterized membrane protein YtjA (UPF0391 family)